MKVLIVTAMYPKPENPAFGSFVRTQVESLRRAGVDVELLLLQGRSRKWNYLKAIFQLRERLAKGSFDLVHAHYGLAGMVGRTEWKVPVVVTFHGDDLLGTVNTRGKKNASQRAHRCGRAPPGAFCGRGHRPEPGNGAQTRKRGASVQ